MKQYFLIILAFMLIVPNAMAQTKQRGTISGSITDSRSGDGIEFASVALLRPADSSLVTGDVSVAGGKFEVSAPYGEYLLRVSFMGYNTYYHATHITLSAQKSKVKIGAIELKASATMMDEVVVTAERSMMEYKLDRRVVNVDKNIVTSGGTATDVLENVPSVAIDNDGNVTLRGSTNVKVLIDGRPSEMLGSDLDVLLEQISASSIESVEVITNPSAKYDPEGMSGIINIKLKEKSASALGLSGLASLNIGAPLPFDIPDKLPQFIPTLTGNLSLNYSTEKYSLFANIDGGMRNRGNRGTNYIKRRLNGATYQIEDIENFNLRENYMFSGKVGAEYYFSKQTSLLLSYQLRYGDHSRTSEMTSHDRLSHDSLYYQQTDTNDHNHFNHTFNLNFVHKFDKPEQELTADIAFGLRGGNGIGTQEQIYRDALAQWDNYYLRESASNNKNKNLNIRLNYVQPISSNAKLEMGYEGRVTMSDQNYDYYISRYDAMHQMQNHILDSLSSTNYTFGRNIHAIYLTAGAKWFDKLSLQAGLRGEYSNVDGRDEQHAATQDIYKEYWQLYPTIHLSYDISEMQSVQLSYSRRVRRPHMHALNPYLDVREGQELNFGNPGIDPEYTDAYELSYNLGINKLNIFTSLYLRQTNNMMTRYGFVWSATTAAYYSPWIAYNSEYDGYWASTWQNLNKGRNYGAEIIFDYQILKWWKANLSINLFQNYIEGTDLLGSTERRAFRASGKLSSMMTPGKGWTIQLSGQYRAPFMDLQTDMDASYWMDLALKKDVLNNRGTINLRVGDFLCTGGFGHTTNNEQLYRRFKTRRISPYITLGFSYKINNGLKKKKRPDEGDDDESGDSDE